MDVPTEVSAIEGRLKSAGFPVAELLRRANVDVAQWQRWKAGNQSPLLSTWSKIIAAADDMAPAKSEAA